VCRAAAGSSADRSRDYHPYLPELIQDSRHCGGTRLRDSGEFYDYDPKRILIAFAGCSSGKVEGVAVMTFGIEEPLLDQEAKRKVPAGFHRRSGRRGRISLLKVDYTRHPPGVQHLAVLGTGTSRLSAGLQGFTLRKSRQIAFRFIEGVRDYTEPCVDR